MGWSFDVPSQTEQLLWRISSIAITGIPLVVAVMVNRFAIDIDHDLFDILLLLPSFLYILCRVLLLVMSHCLAIPSFLSIRDSRVDNFDSTCLAYTVQYSTRHCYPAF
jgi:pilus assembly protein TadC